MTRAEALNYAIVRVLALEHGRELVGDECKSKFQDELDFYHAVIRNLCPITREQVEDMRGEWIDRRALSDAPVECSNCGEWVYGKLQDANFCPFCGVPMTDEAVDMVMERL